MNTLTILTILRGETLGLNLNSGIEEDDLLANAFFDLPKDEQATFWSNLSEAFKTLVAGNEGVPVYLAARFVYRMGEIKPPRLPRKKTLFDFLLVVPADNMPPQQWAGILLLLLVLNRGDSFFWEKQVKSSLTSLEETQGDAHVMTTVVYAFLGLNRKGTIKAEDWECLFMVLNGLPSVPRMELLELLVGAEKEAQRPENFSDEIEIGLDGLSLSTRAEKFKGLPDSFQSVFQAWLDRNQPHQAVAAWLNRLLKDKWQFQLLAPSSPRQFLSHDAWRGATP